MKLSRYQFRFRTLLVVTACLAIGLWVWVACFSPVHRWHRTIRFDNESGARWEAAYRAINGQIPSLDRDEAVSAFCAALDDPSFRVRETAACALGRMGASGASVAVPQLVKALKDPSTFVRLRSAESLGSLCSPDGDMPKIAVPALRNALQDRSEDVRIAAGFALTMMGRGELATPVMATAVREGRDRAGYAILSLGLCGSQDEAAVQALRLALGSSDPRVRQASADALEHLSARRP
jgi:HEAT repeat protein